MIVNNDRLGIEIVKDHLTRLINHNYCTFLDCVKAVELMKNEPTKKEDERSKSNGH